MQFDRFISGAAIAAGSIFASNASAALTQWKTEDGGNGHWYDVVVTPKQSWFAMRDQAANLGGYLASITSNAENDWIYDTFNIGGNESYWSSYWDGPVFGAYRANETLPWTWVSGESWGWSNWTWGTGVGPHGAQYIAHTRGWDDLGANSGNYAGGNVSMIVEWNSNPVPGPTAASMILAAGLLRRRRA